MRAPTRGAATRTTRRTCKCRKRGLYDFTGDYRNIAYFNALPSFANPVAPLGFDQQSFDTRKRIGTSTCNFSPASTSCRTWCSNGTRTTATESRPGCRTATTNIPSRSCCATAPTTIAAVSGSNTTAGTSPLEQGGTTYKNDDQASFNGVNYGDRTTPLLGSTLGAQHPDAGLWRSAARSLYTKVLGTASPFSWMDLYGQYLCSDVKHERAILRHRHRQLRAAQLAAALQRPVQSGHQRRQRAAHAGQRGRRKSGPSGGCASSNRSPPTGTTIRASAR